MKIIIIILLGILSAYNVVFGQKKKVKNAQWQSEQIIIDGNMNEWASPPMFADKETKLAYSINNDEKNIYFCFRVVDDLAKMKIIRAGLTISIDTNGRKKQNISINYPLRDEAIERPSSTSDSRANRPSMEEIKRKFMQKPQSMVLKGFKSGNGISLLENRNGVSIKLDWDENNDMIYEVVIPFKSFWQENLSEINASRFIALNISLDALEKPNFDGRGRPSGTGRPSGGVGRPGGGRPSWVGGSSDEFTKLFSEQKLMVKFMLAQNDQTNNNSTK